MILHLITAKYGIKMVKLRRQGTIEGRGKDKTKEVVRTGT